MPSLIIAVFSPLLQPYVVQKYRIWNLFHLATIDPLHHPLCSAPSHISPPSRFSLFPLTSVLLPLHIGFVPPSHVSCTAHALFAQARSRCS